jgi:prepilin-type N-terminal cleavage/methylation domain-containing protein
MNRRRGFSLVELVISLFALSLIMTLVMQQYLLSKRQYLRMRTLLEQNLELQLVSDLLRDSLRSAGYTPCAGLSSLQGMDGRQGKAGLVAVELSSGKEKRLKINRMDEHFSRVVNFLGPNKVVVEGDIHFEAEEAILIADCYHAEVQLLREARKTKAGTVLTLKKSLTFNYLAPIYLGGWIEEEFFMRNDQQKRLSLFYKKKRAEVLSSLIHSLSVHLEGRTKVEVSLGMEEKRSLIIKTEIRAG